jgi:hypothetical protein
MSENLLTALRQSTPEERLLAFAELASELFATNGRGAVFLRDEERKTIGYVIPADEPVSFPIPGTPEWGAMNALRQSLIRKKLRGELTADEQPLYERLQRESLAAVDAAHPLRSA